jgi:hypothetical protein
LRSETAALYTLVALSFALEMSDPEWTLLFTP